MFPEIQDRLVCLAERATPVFEHPHFYKFRFAFLVWVVLFVIA